MTPEARVAAAIEVLDRYLAGEPAEKALTNWCRSNRFAGSKDRASIRDHVFDAIRQRRSLAAIGGAETGRGIMLGALREVRADLPQVFSGEGYAPPRLTTEEAEFTAPEREDLPASVRLNFPDWLEPELTSSLGEDLEPVMDRMRLRAPVYLRVNLKKATRTEAAARLLQEGIETSPSELADTALLVTQNARRVRQSSAYQGGMVELQDASSQAVIAEIGHPTGGGRALDYCAGGGGKALALAALGWSVVAHDANPSRMKDLPERAKRAEVEIVVASPGKLAKSGTFDLVLVDAPCSGSGAWRRQPEARWSLTKDGLDKLCALQADILSEAAKLVAQNGRLAYATCSLLHCENAVQMANLRACDPTLQPVTERLISPLEGGDGFFVSIHEKR